MKGLVVEIRDGHAAVLREDGVMVTTRRSCQVGETIELSAQPASVFPFSLAGIFQTGQRRTRRRGARERVKGAEAVAGSTEAIGEEAAPLMGAETAANIAEEFAPLAETEILEKPHLFTPPESPERVTEPTRPFVKVEKEKGAESAEGKVEEPTRVVPIMGAGAAGAAPLRERDAASAPPSWGTGAPSARDTASTAAGDSSFTTAGDSSFTAADTASKAADSAFTAADVTEIMGDTPAADAGSGGDAPPKRRNASKPDPLEEILQKIGFQNPAARRRWIQSAIAAMLALVIVGSSYTYTTALAASYVSLDVDESSSVEFSVNRRGRVIGVSAIHADAEDLAKSLRGDVRNKPVEEAVSAAVSYLENEGYLDGRNSAIIASVTAASEEAGEKLSQTVARSVEQSKEEDVRLYVMPASRSDRDEALAQNVSPGRYLIRRSGMEPEAHSDDAADMLLTRPGDGQARFVQANDPEANPKPTEPPEIPEEPEEPARDESAARPVLTGAATPVPTPVPTKAPTQAPTQTPTKAPTKAPTRTPTRTPTRAPTRTPTRTPTKAPTRTPTRTPTQAPTRTPTRTPTQAPTRTPTRTPTQAPTRTPTRTPTQAPPVNEYGDPELLAPTRAQPTEAAQPTQPPQPTAPPERADPNSGMDYAPNTGTDSPAQTQAPERQPTAAPERQPTARPTQPQSNPDSGMDYVPPVPSDDSAAREAERQAEAERQRQAAAAEAERQAEAARQAEAERQAEAARQAEAERQAEAARQAEAEAERQRQAAAAEAERQAEAARQAEAEAERQRQAAAEAERQREAERQAEAARQAEAEAERQRQAEAEAARQAEAERQRQAAAEAERQRQAEAEAAERAAMEVLPDM